MVKGANITLIPQRYNVGIMEVRRQSSSSRRHFFKTMSQEMAAADTIIQENDILYVLGDFTNVERFAEENTLKLLDTHDAEGTVESKSDELEFTEIGIAEIVLMPASNLVNKPVKDSGFREKSHKIHMESVRMYVRLQFVNT